MSGADDPDRVGRARLAAMADDERRRTGAVFTPTDLAERLVRWATDGWTAPRPWRVLDPACGAGAFLAATARVRPDAELHGWDVDDASLAAARHVVPTAALDRRDALVERWDGEPFDLVVGNPPFLGQLSSATARDATSRAALTARYGAAAAGYVDAAALFLLAGLDAVRPGGRVVLVQPESVLGASHAAAVRDAVLARAALAGLWVADAHLFAAAVDTCALVLERREGQVGRTVRPDDDVVLTGGADVEGRGSARAPEDGATWSPLLARARGVPEVLLDPSAGTIGDLATATAGFRQHHYGLVPHLREDDGTPVVTTGMVDPLVVGWGRAPARIGGARWTRPAVDLDAVAADDPAVGAWFRARLRPKVLVAPQTRVVEAAPDPDGRHLPATPLVSAEPHDATAEAAWLLAAALTAPPVTAWALDRSAGTARGRHALKLSARQVLEVPLPIDAVRWRSAAEDLRAGRPLDDVAPDLTAAYGLAPDHPAVAWWRVSRS